MSKDPEFLILKPTAWLPESHWETILGAAVKNHLDPGKDYAPDDVKELWAVAPAETKFENFILQTNVSSSASFQLKVQGLGRLRWEKDAGKDLDLRGKVIYIKRLLKQSTYWKSLIKNEQFRTDTAEWINAAKKQDTMWSKGKRPVCLVVGVLLCQDVIVARDIHEAKEMNADVEVPLGTIAEAVATSQGVPLNTGGVGNTSTESSTSNSNRTYFKAKGKEAYVCGVELCIITLSKHPDEPELTDKSPKTERSRTLGPEDEELDADDIVWRASLDDLGEEDWEVLLRETVDETLGNEQV